MESKLAPAGFAGSAGGLRVASGPLYNEGVRFHDAGDFSHARSLLFSASASLCSLAVPLDDCLYGDSGRRGG